MEKSTKLPRRIAAHYVYTPQGVLPKGIVSVDSSGIITDITTSERIDSLAGVEHFSGMLIPGFVNAHSHLELAYLRGAIAPGGGFATFAASMGRVRGGFTDAERRGAAEFFDARMWAEGVDAVADVCNGDSTFEIKQRSKIRYVNFIELFGLGADSADGVSAVAASAAARGLAHTLTPHSTYSLNTAAFDDAVARGSRSLPLSIHFMESESERELYARSGELWRWYESGGMSVDFVCYGSPADRIIATVAPDRKIMLVHNTFINERELARLKAHFGDNLTLVLCPRSNKYIGNAQPPVDMMSRSGVRIAVGTDSLASNGSLSMVEELKMLETLPLTTLVEYATIAGARALGIDDDYGTIEVGKRSGLVLLTDLDWETMALTPQSRAVRIK